MKLWDKGIQEDGRIDTFTVGRDREMDLPLAKFDILGTMAHITMLESVGLLPEADLRALLPQLGKMYEQADAGKFVIDPDVEDIHSQVEQNLTAILGDTGKKVHTGRSRNDQIMLDVKLFARDRIERTVTLAGRLFDVLIAASEKYKDVLLPGYTHLQVAMPSSFGLWFGAYAESLSDDMALMKAAWDITNRNPLGAAAGYGSSAPLDRDMTTRLLGFDGMNVNVVYAQMGRGRTERIISYAYASLAETIGRMAMDACMYNSQNFGFVRLPDSLTTGSSIMPHKKNPDVFELVRAHCNRLQGISNNIRLITGNLPSGYFRDMQLIKELFVPMFDEMDDVIDIVTYAVSNMTVTEGLMDNPLYGQAFSVEEVNRLVSGGMPFRDAYRKVAADIAAGTFSPLGGKKTVEALGHTLVGSVGNLCNDRITSRMKEQLASFGFEAVHQAIGNLLGSAGL